MGALRPKLPYALSGMCIEEVFDARIGMCVHVSVPLMHSHSTCVLCVALAVDILAVVKSHVCFCGSL